MLVLRPYGKGALLEWQGAEESFALVNDSSVAMPYRRSNFLDSEMDREFEDLQRGIAEVHREIQSTLLMMRKLTDPPELTRLAPLLDQLEYMSALQREFIDRVRSNVERSFKLEPPPALQTSVQVSVEGHRLEFASLDRPTGVLTLRITPASESAEFTWVRPGVDFMALHRNKRVRQRLSPVRNEALLLIDDGQAPKYCLRVRVG